MEIRGVEMRKPDEDLVFVDALDPALESVFVRSDLRKGTRGVSGEDSLFAFTLFKGREVTVRLALGWRRYGAYHA